MTTKIPDLLSNLTDVSAFPLHKQLELLPTNDFKEFIENPELIESYIHQLTKYKEKVEKVQSTLSTLKIILNEEIHQNLITKYQQLTKKINSQISTIRQIYQEFQNLETVQYQLFSSNFNQDFLKYKMKKLIEKTNIESNEFGKKLSKATNENEFNNIINQYKDTRAKYHFRQEKLNRWEEERVSGFI
ncbi:unnamed protein product [Candida verbasci]|uniref:VPS37 C-terminal domain-containing protein n=1 Tax=Candida verbasci TaxID=1227364 RepID=A0A9W4TWF5_9ASCO|nr:unnamed protein product [Candida verbasci]